jgi:DNA-binding LacI/PurR family transcriptional regulator
MTVMLQRVEGEPVYEALAERIRRAIRQGEYRPGDLIGTEHGMARHTAISRVTVRRASEVLIREGLVERRPGKGLYVRENLGSADAVPAARGGQVQVVSGNLQWEPSIQISRGVQTVAKSHGLQVQLYDARGDEGVDLELVRGLPDSGAKGAIIISLHSPAFNEAVFALKQRNFPFVLVDQRLHDIEVPSVIADSHSGGYQAGQMLLELGHRRIAFIGDLIAMTVRERLAGLRDAMNDAGLAFDRSMAMDLVSGRDRMGDWSASIDQAARQLMAREQAPTAIFCSCDGVAKLLYRSLAAMGVRVPEDVSIVGFDDDPVAEWLTPGLTTIRQPFHEMGQAAIELLCARLADPAAPVENRALPVQLVRRASAAPPRA